jgi:hypothetical protein
VALGLSASANAAGQALRSALVCGSLVNLWAAAHYLSGSTRLKRDWVGLLGAPDEPERLAIIPPGPDVPW